MSLKIIISFLGRFLDIRLLIQSFFNKALFYSLNGLGVYLQNLRDSAFVIQKTFDGSRTIDLEALCTAYGQHNIFHTFVHHQS